METSLVSLQFACLHGLKHKPNIDEHDDPVVFLFVPE